MSEYFLKIPKILTYSMKNSFYSDSSADQMDFQL